MKCRRRPWTEAELELLRRHFSDSKTDDIARALGRSYSSVAQKALGLGLEKSKAWLNSPASGRTDGKVGVQTRLHLGQQPWNKGMKGLDIGGMGTRFQAGHKPHTWQPIGSHRITKDGYLQRKVTDTGSTPHDWKSVHQLMWEAANGPVPPGHVVIFKPGRKTTEPDAIKTEHLELVSRSELMRRNTVHRYPKEIADLMRLRGVVNRTINKRMKTDGQDRE